MLPAWDDQVPCDRLLDPEAIGRTVAHALAEDLGPNACDLSAALLPEASCRARIWSRESGVLCGAPWVHEVLRQGMSPGTYHIEWHKHDGDRLQANELLCTLHAPVGKLLTLERTVLNFLQTLSGTATTTHKYVQALSGTSARLLDTRKTLPGLRMAQKYAVRCGGGHNHRLGVFDRVLIKENHIRASGGIPAVLAQARALSCPRPHHIEVTSLDELHQAATHGADVVLLDNFSLSMMREAVVACGTRVRLEASGGLSFKDVQAVAATGVHDISIGSLTKHVQALDLSLLLEA